MAKTASETTLPSNASPGAAPDEARILRPITARGKFLSDGKDRFWLRGVTYGTFAPDENGDQFPAPDQVDRDFGAMAASGINTVRIYTPPPRWLLDTALDHGLRLFIGLPWEQHVAFLDDGARALDIVARVRGFVRSCAGHAAVLCYAVGNEIPSSIVRWHGRRRVERFIRRLFDAVKLEDPDALVTYVNFPTTEYLQLPFLDLMCFNVYLESEDKLSAYLARLQNQAGERPLVLAELGLDSMRHGDDRQAESLAWQLRTTFAEGCAGALVFGWTDEWHRGGADIVDWDFGLTRRDRQPKPALDAVRACFAQVPFPADTPWPHITVVVCSYNGGRTIRDTFAALATLAYPRFDVIVVDDGSTDDTAEIARKFPVKLTSTANRGLSAARNTGWQEASGEIIAYIDDDAYPDPYWLHYIAYRFLTGEWVGVGGPNIAPAGDGRVADCVANAPGGPVHVLVSDLEAEHIPGCNMAFRREALAAIGGFDVQYRNAGDDVDVCWRLQERGGRIGFHAGAVDWHHRRNSISMYWRQQKGYGKAEALLERRWPERYNAPGHLTWEGRLYGRGFAMPIQFGQRVYGGVWGTAAYQSLYEQHPFTVLAIFLMPEWYFVIAALAATSLIGVTWPPLQAALPFLIVAVLAPLSFSAAAASRARFPEPASSVGHRLERWMLTFFLHLLQPVARLWGRIRHGLTPWRHRGSALYAAPCPRVKTLWSESWRDPAAWLEALERALVSVKATARRGGAFDAWDLEIRGGVFGFARGRLAVEEHGSGRQLVRIGCAAMPSSVAVCLLIGSIALGVFAVRDSAWLAAGVLSLLSLALAAAVWRQCSRAVGSFLAATEKLADAEDGESAAA